jgi:hypothetical protein
MYIVRETFYAKPGRAKDIVSVFKRMKPYIESSGASNMRIMTDAISTYWTVVMELDVEDIGAYGNAWRSLRDKSEVQEILAGYMDFITSGRREVFQLE